MEGIYMAILDKLVEKKDLIIFIDERIKQLRRFDVRTLPVDQRETIKDRNNGKILGLQELKHVISEDILKDTTKRIWASNRQKKTRSKKDRPENWINKHLKRPKSD